MRPQESLHDRLMNAGAELVVKTVRSIIDGNYKEIRQSDLTGKFAELKTAPKITTEDCRITWDKSASEIYNFIRGLNPSSGSLVGVDTKK